MRLVERPVVVAYDGSPEAVEAVRTAATLFPGRPLVVVTVWEAGLALALASARDPSGLGYAAPGAAEMAAVDRAQRDRALAAVEEAAEEARALGATVEAVVAPDEQDVAETIAAVAEERHAVVVVVGSRRLGVMSRLFGSTSRELRMRTDLPVLAVTAPR
jgi:nucleotide-binding universal stress UspA family protein